MPLTTVRPIRPDTAPLAGAPPVVLVIGNDREEIAAWVSVMRENGIDASGAEGARAALRRASEAPPDVVVLDFRGRPGSGVAAARQIREREGSTAKLLIASASSTIVLAQCLADYDAFIARPIETPQLLRSIRQLLAEPRFDETMLADRPAARSGGLF